MPRKPEPKKRRSAGFFDINNDGKIDSGEEWMAYLLIKEQDEEWKKMQELKDAAKWGRPKSWKK